MIRITVKIIFFLIVFETLLKQQNYGAEEYNVHMYVFLLKKKIE